MQIRKDHINFSVGPVLIDPAIAAIGAEPVPYFRTPDFSALMLENEQILKELMGATADSRAIFLTGSGTAAMDAVIQNVFTKDDRLLIVNGGSFGDRFCQISKVYGIPYSEIKLQTGKKLRECDLAPFAGGKYTGFVVNMHETSSGVLYDMPMIAQFCKENGLILVVDAISAFLADELNMAKLGADVVITGSQKALAVPPGVSMMCVSLCAVERIYRNTPACYYLDLKSALKNGERGQTPFTPAVGTLLQIHARLNAIASAGGVEKETEKIAALAADFRSRIQDLPLDICSESMSNAVTPLMTRNCSAYDVFTVLKDEYGIWVCPNGGEFKDKIFRVGHIGDLTVEENRILVDALQDLVRRGILK